MQEIIDFLAWMQANSAAKSTIRAYRCDLHQYSNWCNTANINILAVDQTVVIQYIANRSRSYAVSSVARKVACVSRFYSYLESKGITTNPFRTKIGPRASHIRTTRILTDTAITKLLSVITNPRDRLIILLIINTGIKMGKLITLTVDDWHPDINALNIHGLPAVMPAEIQNAINAYLLVRKSTGSNYLFTNKHGDAITDRSIRRHIDKYAWDSGAGFITPQDLRGYFITNRLRAGVSVRELQRTLGLRYAQSVQSYVDWREANMEI